MIREILAVAAAVGLTAPANAGINVATNTNANSLVGTLAGGGITVVAGSETLNGNSSSGTFTGGLSAGIGIDQGIVLSSGFANNASIQGPNNADDKTGELGIGGDAQLTGLAGNPTFDATVLQFDFTTAGGNLFFNYVFASEEYNEFANTPFNDVFGFFLDGTNIALIPGTSTRVSINTVNGGNPFGTNAHHPEFYHNNDLQDGGPFFNIQFDGFTTVFQAVALNLSSGTHHIKLAVADSLDDTYDSAVFIQAGTFSDTPTPAGEVPEPASIVMYGLGALGLLAVRRRVTRRTA